MKLALLCTTKMFFPAGKNLHVLLVSLLLQLLSGITVNAQPAPDEAYNKVITERSIKIVNTLGIKDSVVYNKVVAVLVNQYRALNTIQETNSKQVAGIKQDTAAGKEIIASRLKEQEEKRYNQTLQLHQQFIVGLQALISAEQLEQVKDGLTYSVFPKTYNAYLDMIPSLTAEQKLKIYDWLKEARELAMDGENSDKKHAVFGKYKGKINNYLSAQGYNVKKEGEEWAKRIEAQKKAKEVQN